MNKRRLISEYLDLGMKAIGVQLVKLFQGLELRGPGPRYCYPILGQLSPEIAVDPESSGCYNDSTRMENVRLLDERQERLLTDERKLLNELRLSLARFEAAPEDTETLGDAIEQLDEIFLLVVVGEFNAGKSAFINALLGKSLLKEGVTPTTTHINILKYGEISERQVVDDRLHILSLPAPILDQISIVDTPGTNAIIREHEIITSEFVPRSDLVLFITSADRPFTESERAFLERIRDWGKKIVFIINKIDIISAEGEREQVHGYVAENARLLLGTTPEIFAISARYALQAKNGEPSYWEKSGFEPLEKFIFNTLDESSRLRFKLLNPLGVGSHLVGRYLAVTLNRLDLLKEDFQMLGDIETQLGLYKEDMQRDFNYRMSDIEKILFEMDERGQNYFDDTFRLAKVFDLLSKDRIRREFEQKVVADTPQQIERKVGELIDWLVDLDLRQWQAVHEHLADRRRAYEERILGETGIGSFHYDRERLMEGIGREARRVVESYDKDREAESIAEGAQAAVAASAALEVSAIGLGTLVTILATSVAADITGILMASLIAALGFFIIPARRRKAKAEMREKVKEMRERLITSLRQQFEKEIGRSLQRIQEAISPYTRFVRGEKEKLVNAQQELESYKKQIESIRVRIEEL
jgi:small GTP-binding protein